MTLGTLRSEDGDGKENVAEKVNSCCFNLSKSSSRLLQVTNFVKWRRTLLKLNSYIQVQKERGNFVVACVLPLYIVKLGIFMS